MNGDTKQNQPTTDQLVGSGLLLQHDERTGHRDDRLYHGENVGLGQIDIAQRGVQRQVAHHMGHAGPNEDQQQQPDGRGHQVAARDGRPGPHQHADDRATHEQQIDLVDPRDVSLHQKPVERRAERTDDAEQGADHDRIARPVHEHHCPHDRHNSTQPIQPREALAEHEGTEQDAEDDAQLADEGRDARPRVVDGQEPGHDHHDHHRADREV